MKRLAFLMLIALVFIGVKIDTVFGQVSKDTVYGWHLIDMRWQNPANDTMAFVSIQSSNIAYEGNKSMNIKFRGTSGQSSLWLAKELPKTYELSKKSYVGYYANFLSISNPNSAPITAVWLLYNDSIVGGPSWTMANSIGVVHENYWNRSLWGDAREIPAWNYPMRFNKIVIKIRSSCTAELVIDGLGVADDIKRMPDEDNYYVGQPQSPFYYLDRFGDTPNVLGTGSTNASTSSAQVYELSQNYPNPFNPTTNFEFRILNFELVTLKIYNALGQEIKTLVNENKSPRTYTIQWNGRDEKGNDVPSGTYFYKLTAGKFSETKKMVLIR